MSETGRAMRVLLVTHFYSTHRGGVEIAAHRLAMALCREGDIAVDWIASDSDPVPVELPQGLRCMPAASWNGIEKWSGLPCPVWSPAATFRLWRAVGECDAVHIHDSLYMGNLLAYVFARLRAKAVLVTQHLSAIPYENPLLRGLMSFLNRTLVRAVLEGADRVVFYSPVVERYFGGFCKYRTPPASVPNGVDLERFQFADAQRSAELRRSAGRDPQRALVLFVGRFVKRKGVATVLALARAFPAVHWILTGNGPLRPEDAGIPNVTVLRGGVPDIVTCYQQADLLILPSWGEGFPLTVQEAMACGTPAFVGLETAQGNPVLKPLLITEDVMAADAVELWKRRFDGLLRDLDALRAMRPGVAKAAHSQSTWPETARAYASLMRDAVSARAGSIR